MTYAVQRGLSCALLVFELMFLAGCTVQPVQPWQRAALASPAMSGEMDLLLAAYEQHVQVSKEAASGGATLGGGGCGCN